MSATVRKTALRYLITFLLAALALDWPAACQIGDDFSGIRSDDFSSAELNPQIWKFIDPVGDAAYQLTGSHLKIFLPQGSDHDIWRTGNRAARLMQPVYDADFQVEAHFDMQLFKQYAMQGILVECDDDNFIRFEFNSTSMDLRIYAATFVDGEPRTRALVTIEQHNLGYMRIARSGDEWIQSYSCDRREWHDGATFTHPITVTAIGLYAANAGSFPTVTASIDYFFNQAMPIHPEDKVTAVPQKPARVAADAVSMSEICLGWTDNNDEEDCYLIERSSDGRSFIRIAGVSANTTEYIDKIENNPLGDYTYRVAASNVLGESDYSDPITATVTSTPVITFFYGDVQKFGHLGMPQRTVNVLGNISDADTLNHVTFTLNDAAAESLKIGADRMRLACAGDFNIEIEPQQLRPGENSLQVRAVTKEHAVATKTIRLLWCTMPSPPLCNYTIQWDTVTAIQNVAQVVDGKWKIANGQLQSAAVGFDRLVAIGDTTWRDYEIVVPVTLHNFYPRSGEGSSPGVGILARWKGHTGDDKPRLGHPYGILAWYRATSSDRDDYRLCMYANGDQLVAEDLSGRKLDLNRSYLFKLKAQTVDDKKTRYSLKVWPQVESEPNDWTLTATVAGPVAGSVVLLSHKSDAAFGDVKISAVQAAAVANNLDEAAKDDHIAPDFHPNPFNSMTRMTIRLTGPQMIRLRIFNVLGELLVVPFDSELAAGEHLLSWNGRDQHDRLAASGIYFYTLDAGSSRFAGRLVLVR
ncbi:hypothetical protein JW998_06040 [candidate division KSB1 bacterium]|nr:hypothetical protein [candidate division KSB1 bacterium]